MSVCGVLVTYIPSEEKISAVISSIARQLDHLVIVDNTPFPIKNIPQGSNANIIKNEENIGLAKAQNIGIQWAIDHDYDYVLILDQDSVADEKMLSRLMKASEELKAKGIKIAAVGPRYGRNGTPTSNFVRFGKYRHEYVNGSSLYPYVECSFLISSGMLISKDVFLNVGMMDESLFIDHIDTEWCLRAMSKGYVCYGVYDAWMTHELGESVVKVWWGRKRNISLHHPFRLYYIFRNSILLYTRSYLSIKWKLFDLKRLMFFPMLYLIYSNEKLSSLKYMALGLLHGLQGKIGKLDD